MSPEELLDATLEKARRVPVGGRVDPEQAARRAIESARVEARVIRARRGRFLAGAAAAVVVLGLGWGTWSLTRGTPERSGPSASRTGGSADAPGRVSETQGDGETLPTEREPSLRLASGDVLLGSPDVAFEVVSEAEHRVVRLDRGEMLFDVVPRPEGSFEVRTEHFSVRVLGTVFSVRRETEAIGVRVFEGSVLVRGADGSVRHRLHAGDLWVSGALEGMDRWRVRSESTWNELAREGRRPERRAAARSDGARGEEPPIAAPRDPSVSQSANVDDGETSSEGAPADGPLAGTRSLLARGDFAAVLRETEGHAAEGEWLLLRADALRGLGRSEEAARTYEHAARRLDRGRRTQAAFAAAQLRAETAPEVALQILDRFGVTRGSSPLEERARALRVRLLRSLDRHEEADAEELAHEERFGSHRD